MKIAGRTRVYGILADPIHHVKTPEAMHALFAARDVDGVMVPFHVCPDGLRALVDGLRRMENFGGFIATVPHKSEMLDLCDEARA
jgi:shikimate dehydrogenase